MTEKPTSNVDAVESPDTAPSEKSVGPTPPDDAPPSLTDAMKQMTDFQLVQVGLVALALLHQRAEERGDGKTDVPADTSSE